MSIEPRRLAGSYGIPWIASLMYLSKGIEGYGPAKDRLMQTASVYKYCSEFRYNYESLQSVK
jgi:hypothetical protein